MKKLLGAAVSAAAMLFAASSAMAAGELHIYNWGDYTNPELIKKFEKQEVQLMWALSEVLSNGLENPEYRQIWERLRKVAKWKNPFMSEVLLALMGF